MLKQSFQWSVNAVRGAACEGSESFPNGIIISLLRVLWKLYLHPFLLEKSFPSFCLLPHGAISQTKPVLFLHTALFQGSVCLCAPLAAGYRQAGKTAGSLQDLLCKFVHKPTGSELGLVQPAWNAGENWFISKKNLVQPHTQYKLVWEIFIWILKWLALIKITFKDKYMMVIFPALNKKSIIFTRMFKTCKCIKIS